jgi:hypothetical protein
MGFFTKYIHMPAFILSLIIAFAVWQFYSKKKTGVTDASTSDERVARLINLNKELKPEEAVSQMKGISKERKFKEAVEAIIRLNVDPK